MESNSIGTLKKHPTQFIYSSILWICKDKQKNSLFGAQMIKCVYMLCVRTPWTIQRT